MAQRCMQQSRIRAFVKSGLGTILVVPALLVATAFLTTCSYDQPVAPVGAAGEGRGTRELVRQATAPGAVRARGSAVPAGASVHLLRR